MSAAAGPLPTPIRRRRPRRLASCAALVTGLATVCGGLTAAPATAEANGLATTPPMGWNSWNKFGCSIDETLIKQVADAVVSSGLKAAGYSYVNLDDCWQLSRASDGTIQADPQKFPS